MSNATNFLTVEEKKIASWLWDALYQAPEPEDLIDAKIRLDVAPLNVRNAIYHSLGVFWKEQRNPLFGPNPFE